MLLTLIFFKRSRLHNVVELSFTFRHHVVGLRTFVDRGCSRPCTTALFTNRVSIVFVVKNINEVK